MAMKSLLFRFSDLMEKQSCILYWEVRKINTVPSVLKETRGTVDWLKKTGGKCLIPSEWSEVCKKKLF